MTIDDLRKILDDLDLPGDARVYLGARSHEFRDDLRDVRVEPILRTPPGVQKRHRVEPIFPTAAGVTLLS